MEVWAAIDADVFLQCIILGWCIVHKVTLLICCLLLLSNSDSKTVQSYAETVQNYKDVIMGFFANFMLQL
jgi:hypothetical protein